MSDFEKEPENSDSPKQTFCQNWMLMSDAHIWSVICYGTAKPIFEFITMNHFHKKYGKETKYEGHKFTLAVRNELELHLS